MTCSSYTRFADDRRDETEAQKTERNQTANFASFSFGNLENKTVISKADKHSINLVIGCLSNFLKDFNSAIFRNF